MRLPGRLAACAAACGLVASLALAAMPAHAIEVAPVSEREARQLANVLPDATPLAAATAASQPLVLQLKPQPAASPADDRALQLVDGHPGALVLAALALALWGMRRSWRR